MTHLCAGEGCEGSKDECGGLHFVCWYKVIILMKFLSVDKLMFVSNNVGIGNWFEYYLVMCHSKTTTKADFKYV